MKTLPIFLSVLLLLCAYFADAQVSNYTFSQTVASYGAASNGTVIGLNPQDDDVNNVPLPFTFTFNNTAYNSVNVCSNGFLSFGAISGTEYFPVSDPSTQDVIAPFGQDLLMAVVFMGDIAAGSNSITNISFPAGISAGDSLFDYNGDFNTAFPIVTQVSGSTLVLNTTALNSLTGYVAVAIGGSIKQSVSGTAPNRICEFEFKNFTRFSVFDEVINFKVKLYETSNRIEFVYGNCIPGLSGSSSEVGLKGSSNADFNTRMLNGLNAWPSSAASTIITDSCEFSPQMFPPAGLTYAWEPVNCSAPSLSVAQSGSLVCAGESVTLTASGATTYTWSTGSNAAQVVISPTTSTSYTLVGSSNGCAATVTLTQNVAEIPSATVSAGVPVSCAGETITLSASGASSYTWTGIGTGSQVSVAPLVSTVYTLTASNGTCSAESYYTHSVTPKPQAGITVSTPSICPGQPAVLTASGSASYSWSTGSATSQITVSPASSTTYTLFASKDGCTSQYSQVLTVLNCTGIREETKHSHLVYPNPFSSMLHVRASGPGLSVVISDALGRRVFEKTSDSHELSIDTGDLQKGVYLITIHSAEGSSTRKIIRD